MVKKTPIIRKLINLKTSKAITLPKSWLENAGFVAYVKNAKGLTPRELSRCGRFEKLDLIFMETS